MEIKEHIELLNSWRHKIRHIQKWTYPARRAFTRPRKMGRYGACAVGCIRLYNIMDIEGLTDIDDAVYIHHSRLDKGDYYHRVIELGKLASDVHPAIRMQHKVDRRAYDVAIGIINDSSKYDDPRDEVIEHIDRWIETLERIEDNA